MTAARRPFDLFVGIDWSGAKGPRQPGLQVAAAGPGRTPPCLVPPPAGRWWDRESVGDWLGKQVRTARVLAGFDFAFAPPFEDAGGYFPGLEAQPAAAHALWAEVDRACAEVPGLYGAPFYLRRDLAYHRYVLSHAGKGDRYRYRQRLTERACAAVTVPHPVLKCIGPANVGTGSFAGMRLLNRFAAGALRERVAIWPFDPAGTGGRSVFVEIFPRFFYLSAGAEPMRWREPAVMGSALAWYGSDAAPGDWRPERDDETDAVLACAALRALADEPDLWAVPPDLCGAARREGWIFGVDWGGSGR